MHIEWGIIATYLGLLGASFALLFGMVYKLGRLMQRFEDAMLKIAHFEEGLVNLQKIPQLETAIGVLGDAQRRYNSDASELRERVAALEGGERVRARLPSNHED